MIFISLLCPIQAISAGNHAEIQLKKINFIDSRLFDKDLSFQLKQTPKFVEIGFLSPVNLNQLPPRIDKWLYAVEKLKGEVSLAPEEGSGRVIGDIIVDMAVGAYNLAKQTITYYPAIHYNATVYYHPSDGLLTRIVFIRKSDSSPTSSPSPPASWAESLSGWVKDLFQ